MTVMTEAGKRLLDGFAPEPAPDAQELHRRSTQGRRDKLIPAIEEIESEARAAALREVAEKVERLEVAPMGRPGMATEWVRLRQVRAILTEATGAEKP
jgi:hypothetical protein